MRLAAALLLCLVSWTITHAADQYTLKTAEMAAPKELKDPVRQLLSGQSLQVLDAKGELFCEIWFRKSIPAKATAEQIKNGLTYREVEESTIVGAIRYVQPAADYRKQKIKPGVYTLRLGYQPQDGDHMGTAPHSEFCLLVSAETDAKADPMDVKDLRDASAKSLGGSHPGVLLLFPNEKPAGAPKLADQGMGHWVLRLAVPASAEGKPATLGIGLTVVGHSEGA